MDKKTISAKYAELGYRKGWTFLACPEARLRDAKVAIVGANPGGGGPKDKYPYGEVWSVEEFNAFYDEPTEHRNQVRLWHKMILACPEETLCAQFIPFRSPGLADLARLDEAEAFAHTLWSWVLDRSPAKLFITMGRTPAKHLVDLLGARPFVTDFPAQWGKMTIDVYDSDQGHRIIRMPHPSRYKILGRFEETDEFFRSAVNFQL